MGCELSMSEEITFKKLVELLQKKDQIIKAIENAEKQLSEPLILDKYKIEIDKDGVSISRGKSKKYPLIIPTKELVEIEKLTETQLYQINNNYYMLAWKFKLEEQEEKRKQLEEKQSTPSFNTCTCRD